MEGGDTGLGRDAYGPPGRERSHHAHGPDAPLSPDGVYPPPFPDDEEAEGTGAGRQAEAEDDYGQLLRRPDEIPPRQQRLREPANPPVPVRPPGQFTPNLSPTLSPVHGGPANGGFPEARQMAARLTPVRGTAVRAPAPHGGPNGEVPNGDYGSGRQYRLPNGRRIPGRADGFYPQPARPGERGPGQASQPSPGIARRGLSRRQLETGVVGSRRADPGPSTPGNPAPAVLRVVRKDSEAPWARVSRGFRGLPAARVPGSRGSAL